MSKHTPGPWHRDKEYPIYVWGPGHKMVADLPTDDEDAYLVRMRGVGRGATREEQEANCTLIAAAPDLLEALKQFYEPCDHGTLVTREQSAMWCRFCMARAAIAKAEPVQMPEVSK